MHANARTDSTRPCSRASSFLHLAHAVHTPVLQVAAGAPPLDPLAEVEYMGKGVAWLAALLQDHMESPLLLPPRVQRHGLAGVWDAVLGRVDTFANGRS